jgi:16S rRNA pseudouridine516 synthase
MSKAAAPARLDKLLANLGYGSRREVQALIRSGRVVLDGTPVTAADERIALSPQLPRRLLIGGAPCDPPPGLVLMMHKALGMTCSHKESGPLVYDLLPPRWRFRNPPVSSIGRLDKETSGLLLMTDDGDLLHRIISPKARISKRYRATLARPLRGDEGALFASGTLMLEGETKPLEPAKLEILSPQSAVLTITEGRYHQVRRMFAAAGNHVLSLHRDRIGGLTLDPALDAGATRLLDPDEVGLIFNDQS